MIKEYHVSENLIPEIRTANDWVIGYLNGSNGTYNPNNPNGEWLYTKKIPLLAGESITISAMAIGNPSMSVYFWNGSTYISVTSSLIYTGSTFTAPANTTHIQLAIRAGSDKKTEADIISSGFWVMMVKGSTPKPYDTYGNTWNTKSYCKAVAASESHTNFPIVVRSREQSVPSWNIEGNEQHTGTASPTSPITINGCGDRTENLFDVNGAYSVKSASVTIVDNSINATLGGSGTDRIYYTQSFTAGTYKISFDVQRCEGRLYSDKEFKGITYNSYYDGYYRTITGTQTITFAEDFIIGFIFAGASGNNAVISNIMFQTSTSTADYEPYGYKISIVSNSTTLSPIYLTNQLMMIGNTADILASDGSVSYNIRKYVLTGNENIEVLSSGQAPIRINGLYFRRPAYDACTWLCTHYPCVPNSASWGSYDYCLTVSTQDNDSQMRIRDINYNSGTAADFKAYLAAQYAAGTPVIIWVVISTITGQATVPTIPTTSSPAVIDVNTLVKPSKMSLTYDGYKICKPERKSENLFDGTVRNAIINDSTGEETSNNNWRCSDFIKVADTKVTLSWVSDNQYYQAKLGYYEAADTETFLSAEVIQGNRYSGTFTIPEHCNYIKISYSVVVSGNPVTREDIMLNEGTTAKTYAPYWK